MSDQALATPKEVALYLQVPTRTLDAWALKKTGPSWSKVGRHRRYDWTDVKSWLKEQGRVTA